MKNYGLWRVGDNLKLWDITTGIIWYWSPGYGWEVSAWTVEALYRNGTLLGMYKIKMLPS